MFADSAIQDLLVTLKIVKVKNILDEEQRNIAMVA